MRWRGYDREAVDRCLRQLARSYDRLHGRLTFLEDLIGSWREQGIDLPKPERADRDFRFDPRGAYDISAEPDQPHGEEGADSGGATTMRPRLTPRRRGIFRDLAHDPAAAKWRRIALALGFATTILLAAILLSRRAPRTSALTTSAMPLVFAAEALKAAPQARPALRAVVPPPIERAPHQRHAGLPG